MCKEIIKSVVGVVASLIVEVLGKNAELAEKQVPKKVDYVFTLHVIGLSSFDATGNILTPSFLTAALYMVIV